MNLLLQYLVAEGRRDGGGGPRGFHTILCKIIMFSYSGNADVKKGEGINTRALFGDSSWVFELNSALFNMK